MSSCSFSLVAHPGIEPGPWAYGAHVLPKHSRANAIYHADKEAANFSANLFTVNGNEK